jgi:hypothetical protein
MHRLQAIAHLALARAAAALRSFAAASRRLAARRPGHRLRGSLGQGTVEYVALILLVALVMAGVVAAMKGFRTDEGKELGDVILGKIKQAVRRVQF